MRHFPFSCAASCMAVSLALLTSHSAFAHDPIFGVGPHVLFKGGTEAALEINLNKAGDRKRSETGVDLIYGVTGDLSAGIELPYGYNEQGKLISSGMADISLFSKYRFWRKDSKGLQESGAVMLKANLNNGDDSANPKLGNGANDYIGGVTYGYESLTWYRWASVRYRYNGETDVGIRVGNKTLVDFVAGWRPVLPEYKNPDTVWLLELNTELGEKTTINGKPVINSGGIESFIAPGIFWTYRNFAIKSGIQLPIYSNLNGTQKKSDFRIKTTFEFHL